MTMSEPEKRSDESPRGAERSTDFIAPAFPTVPERAWEEAAAEEGAAAEGAVAGGTAAPLMQPISPPMPSEEIVAELEAWRPGEAGSAADLGAGDRARVIAIANQKGGVGKSTTAVNLGACLAEKGQRVLVIDLDPQGNASTGLGIEHAARSASTYQVLTAGLDIREALIATETEGLSAVASTIDLAGAEIELVTQFSRESRLARALDPVRDEFDFILLDCPPSLGLLTVNALTAAGELIVPIQCEYYALEGLGQLLKNVRLVQQNVNPQLRLTGIVLTMFDARTKLAEQVVSEVRSFFGGRVYDAIIPRSVRLAEAPGFGRPITLYDPGSKGALAYRRLAEELLRSGGADGDAGRAAKAGVDGGESRASSAEEMAAAETAAPETAELFQEGQTMGGEESATTTPRRSKGRKRQASATRTRRKKEPSVTAEEPAPKPPESASGSQDRDAGAEDRNPEAAEDGAGAEDVETSAAGAVVEEQPAPVFEGDETDLGEGGAAAEPPDKSTMNATEEPAPQRKRRWPFGKNKGGQG